MRFKFDCGDDQNRDDGYPVAQFKLGGFNSVICAQVNINIFVLARLAVAEPDVYDTGDKSVLSPGRTSVGEMVLSMAT